jgi:hypothetical protein
MSMRVKRKRTADVEKGKIFLIRKKQLHVLPIGLCSTATV